MVNRHKQLPLQNSCMGVPWVSGNGEKHLECWSLGAEVPTEGPHAEVSDRDFGWGQMGDAEKFSTQVALSNFLFHPFSHFL